MRYKTPNHKHMLVALVITLALTVSDCKRYGGSSSKSSGSRSRGSSSKSSSSSSGGGLFSGLFSSKPSSHTSSSHQASSHASHSSHPAPNHQNVALSYPSSHTGFQTNTHNAHASNAHNVHASNTHASNPGYGWSSNHAQSGSNLAAKPGGNVGWNVGGHVDKPVQSHNVGASHAGTNTGTHNTYQHASAPQQPAQKPNYGWNQPTNNANPPAYNPNYKHPNGNPPPYSASSGTGAVKPPPYNPGYGSNAAAPPKYDAYPKQQYHPVQTHAVGSGYYSSNPNTQTHVYSHPNAQGVSKPRITNNYYTTYYGAHSSGSGYGGGYGGGYNSFGGGGYGGGYGGYNRGYTSSSPFGLGGYTPYYGSYYNPTFGGNPLQRRSSLLGPILGFGGGMLAGVALWELTRNRNNYHVYSVGSNQHGYNNGYNQGNYQPARGQLLSEKEPINSGMTYLITPNTVACNVSENRGLNGNVEFTIDCASGAPFNATLVLPSNSTLPIECHPVIEAIPLAALPIFEAAAPNDTRAINQTLSEMMSLANVTLTNVTMNGDTLDRIVTLYDRMRANDTLHMVLLWKNGTFFNDVLKNDYLYNATLNNTLPYSFLVQVQTNNTEHIHTLRKRAEYWALSDAAPGQTTIAPAIPAPQGPLQPTGQLPPPPKPPTQCRGRATVTPTRLTPVAYEPINAEKALMDICANLDRYHVSEDEKRLTREQCELIKHPPPPLSQDCIQYGRNCPQSEQLSRSTSSTMWSSEKLLASVVTLLFAYGLAH